MDSDPSGIGPDATQTHPQVLSLDGSTGIAILDPIEAARFEIYTDSPPVLSEYDPNRFHFPVDTAAKIEASEFKIPVLANFLVRTKQGELVTDCADEDVVDLPEGEYHIELTGAPMKLYLAVEGSVRLERLDDAVLIETGGSENSIGVRSFHEQPAGSISVPDSPRELMDAVSLLGSALKTHSPERSFPTLRGHPPLIEPGSEFSKPSTIEQPDTGVKVVIPKEKKYIYGVTSLAYYLGADIVEGRSPRVLADGHEFQISRENFHQDVNSMLEQLLFLDCLTRTEGYYQVDLFERTQLKQTLDLDYGRLYDQSLAERTGVFLDVPRESIQKYIPEWDLTADIDPVFSNVQALPFLANDLALIRTPEHHSVAVNETEQEPDGVSDLLRNSSSDSRENRLVEDSDQIFTPANAESIEHVHVGEGYPLGASKATIDSFYRRLDRSELPDSAIHVQVVCNDARMREEEVVESIYGERELLDFNVDVHYELPRAEMDAVLSSSTDFLHYIGHVDERGIRCSDGVLDVEDIDDVRVDAFLLNACRSYEQGMELIRSGGLGGIVTLGDVSNKPAVEVGRALARLLNQGFPLRAALLVAKQQSLKGYQYLVVGDGRLQLAQCIEGLPWIVQIEEATENRYETYVKTFSVKGYGVGSLMAPSIDTGRRRYLRPGTTRAFDVEEEDLVDFLEEADSAIRYDGSLYWADEVVNESGLEFTPAEN